MSFFDFLRNLFTGKADHLLEGPGHTGLGAIKSPPDYRDVPITAVAAAGPMPSKYFEDVDVLPVWYQRQLGACVGHAGAKYKQYLDYLETGKIFPLSARFVYALAKCRDGFAGEGTYPRLVAGIMTKDHEGCATEATVPNDTTLSHEEYVYNRIESNIPKAAFDEARKFSTNGYAFADPKNKTELKQAIMAGRGAMLLMRVGQEWWTSEQGLTTWDAAYIVPLRPPKEIISGHEVFLYGYEDLGDGRTKFYVFNSWSVNWGLGGKAYFIHEEYKPYLDEAITFVDLPNNFLDELHKLPTKEDFRHSFSKNLRFGQRNDEIKALQTALMIEACFPRDLYAELADKDYGLGYYGDVTRRAVLAFQAKYHIDNSTAPDGRDVGPRTRAKLNELFS